MKTDEIKSYINSPQSLIPFMEKSDMSWAIKDNESRWIYMNSRALYAYNINEKFDVEGKLDKEIPSPCSELWEDFIKTDHEVMKNKKVVTTIAVHQYGRGNTGTLKPYFSQKSPFYDDKNTCIGIICHGRIIDALALPYYIERFNKSNIDSNKPNASARFTSRELDIAFWVQQKLSSKEIARKLGISHRTVENRLQIMYHKSGVSSIKQFIRYCVETKLDRYVPSDFIRKGVRLIEFSGEKN